MKMKSSRFYSNWYLVGLAAFTFIFLSQMAFAEPLCTNCSVNLVKWALPRAELLMVGWLIAMVNESWMARSSLFAAFNNLTDASRKARATTTSNISETSSQSRGTRSATD